MPATLIDGKSLAASLRSEQQAAIAKLLARGTRPALAVMLVGDDPASRVYVRNKLRACEEAGVRSHMHEFPSTTSATELIKTIERLNADREVHGILLQMPLPGGLDSQRIFASLAPAKDVDGFHSANLGALLQGRAGFVPCTPAGIMRLLQHARIALAGRQAVIVGRSTIVGKPLALLLLQSNATVTVCHSLTENLAALTRQADVLVAATGRRQLITAEMVKPGACVIDVGINRGPGGGLVGDVDFDRVREVAGAITPVPGGVGPMTVAMLIANTVRAAELSLAGELA